MDASTRRGTVEQGTRLANPACQPPKASHPIHETQIIGNEMMLRVHYTLDRKLRDLADMAAAVKIGCPWRVHPCIRICRLPILWFRRHSFLNRIRWRPCTLAVNDISQPNRPSTDHCAVLGDSNFVHRACCRGVCRARGELPGKAVGLTGHSDRLYRHRGI